tara:strand:- start:122 stop:400 length:279 start_codon:yes stop_codon:yes gene_type:complete
MKSDVKAVRVTGTGSVFAGRTRLRGIVLVSDSGGSAGGITLQDGDSVTQFQGDVANGDVFALNIPEDGIVFKGGMTVSAISNLTAATLLIDK